ncbi:MAG: hypothetical protein K8F91_06445, partial [Candidatus Obscuribacterales bacterium]|nr:hypothetical protein [Candidatus Obscuribacterales bacterium]
PSADPGASALSNAANSAPSQSAAVMSPDAAAAQAPAVDIRVDTPEIQSYGQDAISQPINSAEAQSMAPTIGPSAGPQAFAPTIGAPANAALPVIPANSLPVAAGPGAAQAATIQTGNSGQVVHSGLLSDLQSFLKPKKP